MMELSVIPPIDHGMNQAVDPSRVPDNQAVDILNWEYDRGGTSLISRPGIEFSGLIGASDAKIQSLFGGYRRSVNNTDDSQMMVVYGNKMLGQAPDGGAFLGVAGFTGGANFPSNALWQWSAMNDLVVGVNGATAHDNPVSWSGVNFAFAQQLAGSPPKGKFIAHWNGRLWILKENRLYFSALGSATDWTTGGIAGSGFVDVGYNDGEQGTGIYAHKETLFIVKRSLVYRIITINPNTDPTGWRLELVTKNGGCSFASSMQSFGNDLIFLSRWGIASMGTIYTYDDFQQGVISRQLKFDFNFNMDSLAIPSVIRPDKEQYMLFYPDKNETDCKNCLVMDRHPDGTWRFVRWRFVHTRRGTTNDTEVMPVSAATVGWYSGRPRIYIGQGNVTIPEALYPNANAWVYTLADDSFDDQAAVNLSPHKYDLEVTTKRYHLGSPFERKLFNKMGVRMGIPDTSLPANVDLQVQYSVHEPQVNLKPFGEVNVTYDQTTMSDPTIWRRLSDEVQGRVGNTIQFKVRKRKTLLNVGLVLKEIAIIFRRLKAPLMVGRRDIA